MDTYSIEAVIEEDLMVSKAGLFFLIAVTRYVVPGWLLF